MDIKGLNLIEISRKMESYVAKYSKGFTLSEGQCLFAESYMFDFEEIFHLIPQKHHHLFKNTDKFTGASGFVEMKQIGKKNNKHTIMFLADEFCTKVYLLYLQETDGAEEKATILKDFLCT